MTAVPKQIVVFRVADDVFAANVFSVERVLRYRAPTPVPEVPPWVAGVIDYQGKVVPVIDLRARFELATREPTSEARILVLQCGAEWVAAIVDAVLEVTPVTTAAIAAPPALFRGLAGQYLDGMLHRDGKLILILNVEALFSTTDRLMLGRVTAEPAQRD